MEQFPKIARARMAAHATSEHPEAEQLNAFAENALDARERESMLAHLATCSDCREIVSLAVESRPEGAPLPKPARGGFRWATFQWAAVAASVAIVTVAVLVVGPKESRAPQRPTESVAMQRQQTPESLAAPKVAESPADDRKASRVSAAKPDADLKARGKEVAGNPGVVSGGGNGLAVADGVAITDGGFGGIGVYSRNAAQKPPSTDALAKLQEKKESGTAQPTKSAQSRDYAYSNAANPNDTFFSGVPVNRPAPGSMQGGIVQNAPPPAPAADGERARAEIQTKSSNEVSKDKQVASAPVAPSAESVELAAPAKAHASLKAGAAKGPSASSTGGIVSTRFDSAPLMWRVRAGTIESSDDGGKVWQERTPAKDFQPMTVVAAGQQVWAGGKAGTAFLSRDNGETWTKISLTGDDIIPLGDVTAIKISNPLLVDVILSSGDDWQTNDGGKSFRLLPRKP